MENILVFPENKDQLSAIKDFLSKMKIKFQTQMEHHEIVLSKEEKELIENGLNDIENNNIKTKQEAHEIFRKCLK